MSHLPFPSHLLAPLLLAALLCGAPGCRDEDAHGTTERIWRTGTMRVGLTPDAAVGSEAAVGLLVRVAAGLGARVQLFPARLPDLEQALAAGVIDCVVTGPTEGRGGAQSDAARAGAARAAAARVAGVEAAELSLEGRPVTLLMRRGEARLLSLARQAAAQAGPRGAALQRPPPPARNASGTPAPR